MIINFHRLAILATCLLAGILPAAAQSSNAPAPYDKLFKDETDKLNYAIGASLYLNNARTIWKRTEIDPDTNAIARGFQQAAMGSSLLTDDQVREILNSFSAGLSQRLTAKHKKAGEELLAKNKEMPGVKITDSGLQYKILKEGKGAKPKLTDSVKAHYRGTLVDGTIFDDNLSQTNAPEFPVSGLIKGMTEALTMMPVGSKWQIWVPDTLAYGDGGFGTEIGPGSTLIFEIEVLSAEPTPAKDALPSRVSPTIVVPSAEEIKKGVQPHTLTPEEEEQLKAQQQKK